MKKLLIMAFVPLVVLFLAAPSAKADEVERGTIFAAVYGGLYANDEVHFGLGGSIEYFYTERYGFQGELNLILSDPSVFGVIGSFVYNIPVDIEKIAPYATGGLSYWVNGDGVLKLNFGGGIRYQMSDSTRLKFDLTVFVREGTRVRLVGGVVWAF
jgi:hypothetical protein